MAPRATVALTLGLLAAAYAQAPLELTTANFVQAARQPVAWLIHVEQPTNAQSLQAAQVLKPTLAQCASLYHGSASGQARGVRVAHVDVQRDCWLLWQSSRVVVHM